MMMVAPWLAWLAAITSLVLLVYRSQGETRGSWLAVLWIWFLSAAYFQFFGRADLVSAAGLAAQTLLAVWLLVWQKLEG